ASPSRISSVPPTILTIAQALLMSRGSVLTSLRSHQWEQDDIPDRRLPGQQHREPIDPDALARRRRHPDLERAAVVLVVIHRLGGARGLRTHLGLEPGALIVGVVELGESVRDLLAVDEQLEPIAERRVLVVA